MKNIIKTIISLMFVFLLTGCLSKEEGEIVQMIEGTSKEIMLDYLERNYNISNIDNLKIRFDDERGGSVFGVFFDSITDYVTAIFNKNGNDYIIMCNYNTKKCYDSYAYEMKVNPILVNKVSDVLKKSGATEKYEPDYVRVDLNNLGFFIKTAVPFSSIETDYFGVFDNGDSVTDYNDVINYYNQFEINDGIDNLILRYRTDKIVTDNLDAYKSLSATLNFEVAVYNFYKNGIVSEYLFQGPNDEPSFYSNDMIEIGDFIVYWLIDSSDIEVKSNDFKFELVKNNYDFEKEIELYDKKYSLYGSDVLMVKNVNGIGGGYIDIEHKSLCNGRVIYKNEIGDYVTLFSNSYGFNSGESSQKFAIYCILK